MRIILYAIIAIVGIVYAVPRPMETLNRYNVVLVHGAAPETQGFESECNSGAIRDAYTITTNYIVKPDSFGWNLGDAVGMCNNKCSVRRSLFEEAQEVRAGGQDSLRNKRESQGTLYRTIPSRNILIAHSMGGVASHEYVTDTDVYNDDVDKVIFKKFCIGA